MTRYFVGIEIPHDIAARLAMLRGTLPDARWIDQADMHLTLRFVGELDGPTVATFVRELGEIAQRSFTLQLEQPGFFGHDRPRAVWMGVAGNETLNTLHDDVDRAARLAGLPPDGRKYSPHVTLARIHRGKPAAVARYLSDIGNPFIAPFNVDRFVLFTSGRSRGGGPYVAEEIFPLGEAGANADDDEM
ncbi:MAG: RNA 2',3'-cyclic phosphodiesterase [Hyphomicrobiaceae bacterium]